MVVPDDDAWFDVFAVRPVRLPGGEAWVRGVAVDVTGGQGRLAFTWDELAGSVSVRFQADGLVQLELTREFVHVVSVLRPVADGATAIEYGAADLVGRTLVQLSPLLSITDAVLHR